MASTKEKKSTTTKKNSAPAKSGGTKNGSSRAKKATEVQKRPIRREVWGVVLLVLALFTGVSYFNADGIFIDWFALLLKGTVGYGYWLTCPAFLLAALILLFHRGRPVLLKVICALLSPVALGALLHMLLCAAEFPATGAVKQFWQTGVSLRSGGTVAGVLAAGCVKLFGKIASGIVFVAALLTLLAIPLYPVIKKLVEKHHSRIQYEEREEEMPRVRVTPLEPARKAVVEERPKQPIDIPLDDEPAKVLEKAVSKEPGRFTSFFRHKAEGQKTPDQVLKEHTEQTPPPAPPVRKPVPAIPEERPHEVRAAIITDTKPVQQPVRPPEPVAPAQPEPALKEETPAPARKEKLNTAQEVAAQTAAVTAEIEKKMAAEGEEYQYPPITLLEYGNGGNVAAAGAELRNNSRRLAETLTSFGVDAKPADVVHGPSVTRYEFVLDQGVKLSKITNLADDIALALGATGVRIAPIPDKISVVGIEVPNKQVTPVLIRDVIESRTFTEHKSRVAFAVGKDISGKCIVGDIEKLPHVLIAGTTGSGKSVCTNSLIISLLYKSTPDEVRFIMVDPKMVELAPYNGIPHLLIPVVTDPKKAAGALQWAVFEMMKRYKTFSEHGVKKLEEYNRLAKATEGLEPLPSVVVVIDELADLMLVAAKEVEESICRVAQMGRAAGMHLVIATQRPSADVITGLMKANIPSRVAFAVASSLESRIILDNTGAEKLVGRGDMLYAPLGAGKPQRVQGCFISPEEIEQVVAFVKQAGAPEYSQEVLDKIEESLKEKDKGGKGGTTAAAEPAASGDEGDELLPAAVDVVLETGQASVSMLQRRLKLGYSRAARLVDQMEERGIVGPFEGSKPRQLLITRAQWQEMQMDGETMDEEPPFPMDEA